MCYLSQCGFDENAISNGSHELYLCFTTVNSECMLKILLNRLIQTICEVISLFLLRFYFRQSGFLAYNPM